MNSLKGLILIRKDPRSDLLKEHSASDLKRGEELENHTK